MWDYTRLRNKMAGAGLRQRDVAREIGISRTMYNLKLNNKGQFRQGEIQRICDLLKIPYSKAGSYFFTPAVQKTESEPAAPDKPG